MISNSFIHNYSLIANGFAHIPVLTFILLGSAIFFCALFSLLYINISKKISTATNLIMREIGGSVQSKFINFSPSANDLIEIAIDIWRMKQRLTKISGTLPENSRKSLDNSIQRLYRYLEKNDLELLDYIGQPYSDTLSSVDVVSTEKDKNVKKDTIIEMIEPGILIKGKLIRKAQVIVGLKK